MLILFADNGNGPLMIDHLVVDKGSICTLRGYLPER